MRDIGNFEMLPLFRTEMTGRGQHLREGLQGFARAALAGGFPCLLASKWDVPAQESVILMRNFYAHMALERVWTLRVVH